MNTEENETKHHHQQQPNHDEEEEEQESEDLHNISSPNSYSTPPQSIIEQNSQRYVFPSQPHQSSRTYVISPSPPHEVKSSSPSPSPSLSPLRQQQPSPRADHGDGGNNRKVEDGGYRKKPPGSLSRSKVETMKRRALLTFRTLSFTFCLVSFSVLAADKNQGWALDSFYNYKEFRYCMAVNVIGFGYSGLQTYNLIYSSTAKKLANRNRLWHYFDFGVDQMLAYMVLSASSSATFRIEDWESNWGKDNFPLMAKASVAFSYLAFSCFAFSSLISGHTLYDPTSSYS